MTCDIVVLYGLGAGLASVQHAAPGPGPLRQLEAEVAEGRPGVGDLRVRGEGRTARQRPGMDFVDFYGFCDCFALTVN